MRKLTQFMISLMIALSCFVLPEKVDAKTYLLKIGDSISLSDSHYHNATGYTKVWTSSNPSVASVYGSGINATVVAKQLGVSIITCQTNAYKTVVNRLLGADGEWYTVTNTYEYSATSTYTIRVVEFVDVEFNPNKGEVDKAIYKIEKNTTISQLPVAERLQYLFQGWYTEDGKKVTTSTSFKFDTTVYAKWKSAKPSKVNKPTLKTDYKQIYVTYDKIANAEGYQIAYATKKDFSNAKKVTTKNTKKYLIDLKTNQTYYVKIRAYRLDSKGEKAYGAYSDVVKVITPKYVLSDTQVNLVKGSTQTIKLKGASGKETYKSLNPSIASVSSKGTIKALKKGKATIQVTHNCKTFKCNVEVDAPTLNRTSVKLLAIQTYQLKVKNTNLIPKFTSLDENVATIDSKGTITAKKAGVVYVQAKIQNQIYQCKVIVEKPSFSTRDKSLVTNETYQIRINNTTYQPTFINKTPDIISVSEDGKVTTLKKGEGLVHVVLNEKKYAIKFHVEKPKMPYSSYTMSANSNTEHILKIDTNLPVTYTSSDKNVLTIDENGKMYGHKAGTVTISAKIRSHNLTTIVNVEEVKFDKERKEITIGEQCTLNVEGTNRKVIDWEIENENFINLGDGTFEAAKASYTTIYAVLENNDKVPFDYKVIGKKGTITNPFEVDSFSSVIYDLGTNAYYVALELGRYKYDFISCIYEEGILKMLFNITLLEEDEYHTPIVGYTSVSSINDYYYDELGNQYRLNNLVYENNHKSGMIKGKKYDYELHFAIDYIVGDTIVIPFRTTYTKQGSVYKADYTYYAIPITKK